MVSAIGTALSGLNAASTRLSASASNIANLQSTQTRRNGVTVNEPYTPVQVDQQSVAGGGTRAIVRPVPNPTVPVYDPSNAAADAEGIVQFPNVNLEEEVVNQVVAKYDFKANLQVIKTEKETTDSLLNILA